MPITPRTIRVYECTDGNHFPTIEAAKKHEIKLQLHLVFSPYDDYGGEKIAEMIQEYWEKLKEIMEPEVK